MQLRALKRVCRAAALVAASVLLPGCAGQGEGAGILLLSGNIELTQVDVGFKIPGKLVELNIEEGQSVSKDDLLARLDDTQLEQQRAEALAGVKSARSRLAELQSQFAFQKENVAAQIEQRAAELAQAQAGLDAAVSGSRPQEIAQAKAAVARARSLRAKALSHWERAQQLTVEKDISRAQYEDFRTAFEAAAAELRQAEERLALAVEGPRREDLAARRAQVNRAQGALRQAEALRLDLKRLERSIETTRAEAERAEALLSLVESQLEDTRLLSPLGGVVMVKSAEAGEVLPLGAPVATIGDLARPWMRAYIPSSALGRIRLGQPAVVRTDSFPGKTYQGAVVFIAPEAEFTPKQIQTAEQRTRLVYRIKIQLENPRQELKLNMPCEAEIELQPEAAADRQGG